MQKKPDFEITGPQIIEELSPCSLMELVICLDLDYYFVINHQIEALDAEQFLFVNDPDTKFSFDVMPALPQLPLQCHYVQALQEPEPERVVNLKKCPDDRPGERFFEEGSRRHPITNSITQRTDHRIDAPNDPTDATTDPPLSGVNPGNPCP
jgi:hypothetical protein